MLFEFIKKHKILEIGLCSLGECYAELILTEPYKFVDVILQSDHYISTVTWYERASIQIGSRMGFGGPVDPEFPEEYFFSETSICKVFEESACKDEYCSYMDDVYSSYKNVSLVPSFEIRRKK